jgi:hypothetical protein
VADELDDDADALARADHALFAYLDELETRRAPAVTPAAEPPPAPTPAPVG